MHASLSLMLAREKRLAIAEFFFSFLFLGDPKKKEKGESHDHYVFTSIKIAPIYICSSRIAGIIYVLIICSCLSPETGG